MEGRGVPVIRTILMLMYFSLGTGCNIAYVENTHNVKKWNTPRLNGEQVIGP